ncbi:glycoside hydrolase family 9 [Cellulomonas flavigena DSM 20109]|uniref:Endoglucanase n=1 Tax=Cellulomonas flavigena (strain ATCC 482 / DSM 20109 / BCRC 11376 / JCM 18109 / NBRC 3775 / NCIMB 8073 / NRS 134) TaxID=446466 RepID=D5UD76_CELFN|nr:glycoside hydrolase family 9 protein [Cellulomonas flavigena]ADG74413.1 glycoside hydrolase family 9 [Cellulomonas flavigena DSM 20109]
MVSRRTRRGLRAATAITSAGVLAAIGLLPAVAAVDDAFDDGPGAWIAYGTDGDIDTSSGALCVDVPAGSAQYGVGVVLNGVAVEEGATYTFAYTASASTDVTIRALVGQNGAPYGTVLDTTPALTAEPTAVEETFTASASYPATATDESPEGQIAFQLGGFSDDAWTFCLDDVSLSSESELLPHTSFAEGLGPWGLYGTGDPVFADGEMCVEVPGGYSNPWDAGLSFTGLPIEEGENYVLTLTGRTEPATPVRVIVGEGGGTYRMVLEQSSAPLGTEATTLTYPFTANTSFPADGDAPGQVAIHLGKTAGYTFCLSEVSLSTSATPPPPYEPDTGPRVRVNQVGYLPFGPKRATLVTDATEAVAWQLLGADGDEVADGESQPVGADASSGENVHVIDFSDVTATGEGLTLVADGETSHPFAIDADLYAQLRYDALNYFYLARSGIDIEASIVGEEYAREAGHVGVAPNQGDTEVPCIGPRDYYDGWTCDYTLDVTGGWYDAGDHGKYVVNGGISVAQLLATYERTLHVEGASTEALADGTLNLPEHGNGVPDVLDEARWELEWMLKMVAPSGEYAGMVHHKIHDEGWTGLPLMPADDPQARSLHRPSTAATLNLAAVAAQGARLFSEYDQEFADTLLAVARSTYEAALAHPDVYAPGAAGSDGGGPYDDSDVSDEFYWAAAELYVTTGEARYATDLTANPHHTGDVFPAGGFYWGGVAALGRLTLATVPNDLPDRDEVQASVVAAAGRYVAAQQEHPWGSVYSPDGGVYAWGSNSSVANILVVVGTAYDLTGDVTYQRAALEGLDYLFGRNALNQSYVTDWGTTTSQNQHSRWFAHQLDPALPNPPKGSLAGGPNSQVSTWDPTMQSTLSADCPPATCYLDEISSWASNEITVNWNSALSWVASFAADQTGAQQETPVAPVVTSQPSDQSVGVGATASFTAAASGVPAPTVQWQVRQGKKWRDVPGATSTTLTVVASTPKAGGEYRAVFTNASGTATSDVARLTVKHQAPVVIKHPVDTVGKVGQQVTFTAAASGHPQPTVRWQQRRGEGTWTDVKGAKKEELRVLVTPKSQGLQYRAVFTNPGGTVTTDAARLTVRGGS